jgi:hypothetical protein
MRANPADQVLQSDVEVDERIQRLAAYESRYEARQLWLAQNSRVYRHRTALGLLGVVMALVGLTGFLYQVVASPLEVIGGGFYGWGFLVLATAGTMLLAAVAVYCYSQSRKGVGFVLVSGLILIAIIVAAPGSFD